MTTFGVEEEFLLVDSAMGATVPAAVEVGKVAGEELGGGVHVELQQTQIEFASPPCGTLAELGEVLSRGRDRLAAAARGCGVWLVPSGTPPLGGAAIISNDDRFAGIEMVSAPVPQPMSSTAAPGRMPAAASVSASNHVSCWGR